MCLLKSLPNFSLKLAMTFHHLFRVLHFNQPKSRLGEDIRLGEDTGQDAFGRQETREKETTE